MKLSVPRMTQELVSLPGIAHKSRWRSGGSRGWCCRMAAPMDLVPEFCCGEQNLEMSIKIALCVSVLKLYKLAYGQGLEERREGKLWLGCEINIKKKKKQVMTLSNRK